MLYRVMVPVCAVPQQGAQITSPLQERSSLLRMSLSSWPFRTGWRDRLIASHKYPSAEPSGRNSAAALSVSKQRFFAFVIIGAGLLQ
jgi:hypothetical protein